MFDTITQAVRRWAGGRSVPVPANPWREFAGLANDPLVSPLLAELTLHAGTAPPSLYLAAALHLFLRRETDGGQQFAVADLLATATDRECLMDGYFDDAEEMEGVQTAQRGRMYLARPSEGPPTPIGSMLFTIRNGSPVPVLPGSDEPCMWSLRHTAEMTHLTVPTLVALYRVAAGEPVEPDEQRGGGH